MNLLDTLLSTLLGYWLFDMSVFSNPWMYVPLFIPVCFYFVIFSLKWTVITLPVWLPIAIIIKAVKGDKK